MISNDPIMSSFTKVIQPINTASSVPVSGPSKLFFTYIIMYFEFIKSNQI